MANLKISVLDVGHGDFIFAESPKRHTLVIDCGPGDGDVSPSKFLSKVSVIDELQISHPHTDHFGDIAVFQKKTVRSFRCPNLDKFKDKDIGWRDSDAATIKILRNMKAAIPTNDAAVPVGDGFVHCVYPAQGIDYADPNTASFVTVLGYGNFKMLLGGDLPASGWESLLQNGNFVKAIQGTDVLKVPHHGREVGCSDALFDVIQPRLCIISDKPIDESNENTVCTDWYSKRSRGATLTDRTVRKVLTTRTDGSVHIQTAGDGFWVTPGMQWKTDDYK